MALCSIISIDLDIHATRISSTATSDAAPLSASDIKAAGRRLLAGGLLPYIAVWRLRACAAGACYKVHRGT